MKLLWIVCHPPYQTLEDIETLDSVLAASQFCETVSVWFEGDGVYQLLPHAPEALLLKPYTRIYSALDLYGIEKVYVCLEDLAERTLTPEQLSTSVIVVDRHQSQQLLKEYTFIQRG